MNIDIDKITKVVAERANISEDQARQAVATVLEQLKGKVPEIETLLKDKLPQLDELMKGLPFGGLKR